MKKKKKKVPIDYSFEASRREWTCGFRGYK